MDERRRRKAGARGRPAPGWMCILRRPMRRELSATVGEAEVEISVEAESEGRFRVKVGDRELEVDAREVRPGTWSLLVDGRSYLVDLEDRKQGLAIAVGGAELRTVMEDARRKRLARAVSRAAGGAAGEVIRAPIAGKVVKLLVGVGDAVEAGQGVAVLEAMKMENEIKADRGGQVATIHVEAGKSVETSEPLITLS
jgi:biotin carboxyl carrier protein